MTCLECSPLGFFFDPVKLVIFIASILTAVYFLNKVRKTKEINKKLKFIYAHIFFLVSPVVFFIFFNGCESIYARCNKPGVILGIIAISAVTSLLFVLMIAPFFILKYYKNKSISVQNKKIINLVDTYSKKLEIKEPRVFILDSAKPRAFSFTYFFNAIFLSVGLIEILKFNELKAVILHELSHIKQRSPLLKFSSLVLRMLSPLAGFSSLKRDIDLHETEADKFVVKAQNTEKYLLNAKNKIRNYE